jgi:hypothetical protein
LKAIQENPPTPKQYKANLGMAEAVEKTSSSLSLPWNPSMEAICEANMASLCGTDNRAKSSITGGLAPQAYISKPEFRDKAYRISKQPSSATAASFQPKFQALLQASKKPGTRGIKLSDTETVSLEVQLRRANIMLSLQDWLMGTIRRLAEKGLKDPESALDILGKLLGLCDSSSKTGLDLQTLVTNLQHNIVLRRRDALLAETHKGLSDTVRKDLRHNDLGARSLFNEDVCTEAHTSYLATAHADIVTKSLDNQSKRYKGGYKSPTRPSTSGYNKPKSNSGSQAKSWQKPQKPQNDRDRDRDGGKHSSASGSSSRGRGRGGRKK